MTDREAVIAFNLTDRVGSVTLDKLIAEYGSPSAAWEAMPPEKQVSRSGLDIDVKRELDLAKRYGVTLLTCLDDDYPAVLKSAPRYPLCLYIKGSVASLSKKSVAMVGTRKATTYGLDHARIIARDLARQGVAIISGLALGIDAASHKGALEGGGITVGVLGSALDKFYPDQNRELAREMVKSGGAVVSQFPFGRECDTTTFPIRNQVVAALSCGVVAIESPKHSGTLLTCQNALDLGRPVMALPGRVDARSSEGCLALIRDGAALVRNAQDVCDELGVKYIEVKDEGPSKAAKQTAAFTVEESLVMRHVDEIGVSMDVLAAKTGFSTMKVMSLTMSLRLKGRVRFLPGNRVALPAE